MIDIRKLFYVVAALGVFACQSSEKEQQDTVALTPYVVSSIEDVFSDVEIVPLLFEGETYPSVANQVQVSDGYIFVGDNKKQIHVFDKDGRYVSCSSWARGGGPGEYDMMMGFSWNSFSKSIQLLTPHKLMQYDVNFNPVGEIALPTKLGEDNLIFDQIYGLSKYNNLLLPTGTSESPYCGYVFDAATGKVTDSFDYSADVLVPITMQEQCLFRIGGDKIYFVAPAITGKVFSLSDGQLKNEITFSYDSDFISKADISKYEGNEDGLGRYLMECDKSIPVRVMI
ncbi:MAG: 6-bladed beta-propeller [Muribaculaceae bacterium]|nr:6-bladed beta-propeller [Muribaculaceae bacterium]